MLNEYWDALSVVWAKDPTYFLGSGMLLSGAVLVGGFVGWFIANLIWDRTWPPRIIPKLLMAFVVLSGPLTFTWLFLYQGVIDRAVYVQKEATEMERFENLVQEILNDMTATIEENTRGADDYIATFTHPIYCSNILQTQPVPSLHGSLIIWDLPQQSVMWPPDYEAVINPVSEDQAYTVVVLASELHEKIGTYSVTGRSAYTSKSKFWVIYWPERTFAGVYGLRHKDPTEYTFRPGSGSPLNPENRVRVDLIDLAMCFPKSPLTQ